MSQYIIIYTTYNVQPTSYADKQNEYRTHIFRI